MVPSSNFGEFHLDLPFPPYPQGNVWAGPNDSSINRGDREDTGDNEAGPDELGSGPAEATVDSTSLGGTSSISQPSGGRFDVEQEREDYDGLEVMEANDGRLGLTGIDGSEAEDWAADTGETRSGEEF